MDVSLVIPTFNKRKYLLLTLASLVYQDFQGRWEILIVDDGSTDDTPAVLETFAKEYSSLPLTTFRTGGGGRSAARNTGIHRATGDIILFIDDDQIVANDFVRRHQEAHRRLPVPGVICGYRSYVFSYWPAEPHYRMLIQDDRIPLDRASFQEGDPLLTPEDIAEDFDTVRQLSYGGDPQFERSQRLFGNSLDGCHVPWIHFITSNVSVRRHCLARSGLFCESFTGWGCEDLELGYRLYKSGSGYALSPEAISYHQFHPSDRHANATQETENYRRFCGMHPDIGVCFFWRKSHDALPFASYNALVAEQEERKGRAEYAHWHGDYVAVAQLDALTHGSNRSRRPSARSLLRQVRECYQRGDNAGIESLALQYRRHFGARMEEEQAVLTALPNPKRLSLYPHLNNGAECLLLLARSYASQGAKEKARNLYKEIIDRYSYAQFWENGVLYSTARTACSEREALSER
jgi:GT2 family glycosyltransferase